MSAPLVTALVRLHNNAAFAREAITSALAQDYEKLEVLVADDASTDGSFAIAERLLADYRGPHRTRLIRQARNLGAGGNLQRAAELSAGEILVLFDGDDVSRSDRVKLVVAAFDESAVMQVAHRQESIDAQGQPLPQASAPLIVPADLQAVVRRAQAPPGSRSAYRRDLLVGFRDLSPLRQDEDRLLTIRAFLLGRLRALDEVLVQRRFHAQNVSAPGAAFASAASLSAWWRRHLIQKIVAVNFMAIELRAGGQDKLVDDLDRQRRRFRVLRAAIRLKGRGFCACLVAIRQSGMTLRPALSLLLPLSFPRLGRALLLRNRARREIARQAQPRS